MNRALFCSLFGKFWVRFGEISLIFGLVRTFDGGSASSATAPLLVHLIHAKRSSVEVAVFAFDALVWFAPQNVVGKFFFYVIRVNAVIFKESPSVVAFENIIRSAFAIFYGGGVAIDGHDAVFGC